MHFCTNISHSLPCEYIPIVVIGKTAIDHTHGMINAACTWMFVFLRRRYLTEFLFISTLVLPT